MKPRVNKPPNWTPEEKLRLKQLWKPGMRVADLVPHFPGRTEGAINSRISEMKLDRPRDIRKRERLAKANPELKRALDVIFGR